MFGKHLIIQDLLGSDSLLAKVLVCFVKTRKLMNKAFFFLFFPLFLIISYTNDDQISNFPAKVSFDVSGRMLEGKRITCIDFDAKGNIFIASDKEIYYKNGSDQKTYSIDYSILDIAIAPDETLWIGTNGGGLGHMTDKGITWYTSNNSGLPSDYVRNVEVAPNGNIWFSSCAFRLGGLGMNLLSKDEEKWVSINVPVGLRMNPFTALPDLYLVGEYNPMIIAIDKIPVIHTVSLGFRYILNKKQ